MTAPPVPPPPPAPSPPAARAPITRPSAARLNSSGLTPAVPCPPPPPARPAVTPTAKPSKPARPALAAWTLVKVKNRAMTGHANTARPSTSSPCNNALIPVDLPAIANPTANTSAMTGLRMIS